MNKPSRLIPFVIGLLLGVLGMVYVPGHVRPYLPDWAMGNAPVAKGTVMAKQKKENTLLLTVNTAEGALTATFTKKVDEIALLVNEKDMIEFMLPKYAAFIEDPRIVRIKKEQEAASEPPPAAGPAEKGPKEGKPGQQGKQPAAAPAPGSAVEKDPPDRK